MARQSKELHFVGTNWTSTGCKADVKEEMEMDKAKPKVATFRTANSCYPYREVGNTVYNVTGKSVFFQK